MKKILFMMSLCALAFVSCQKPEIEEAVTPEAKYTYTFVGTASPEVKASVGDKVGNKWPMLWEAGDKIGVYTADGATFVGVAEIAEEYAGGNKATFTLSTNTSLTNGQALSIVYPYVEGAERVVPTKQSLKVANSSAGIGANALATATTTFAGEDTVFELSYSNAYLRFVLNSSEFKDYTLNGVTLWAAGTKLSGNAETGSDYVKVTLAEPAVLGEGNNEVWMTANPMDLTGKTVWAIVHMTKGIETVTLPVQLKGAATLPASSVTSVALPALAKSLAPDWYEPIETRYIAAYGEGWCYGPENTIVFPKSEVAQILEFKARGNFMKVKEPKAIKVAYACDIQKKTGGVVYINGADTFTSTATDGTAERVTFNLSKDYTASVAVKQCSNYVSSKIGHMSALYVMAENDEIIWGTNLWLAVNEFKTTAYTNGDVLDRNIGSDRTLAALGNWKVHGCYFQWGRPFAFGWDNGVRTLAGIEAVKVAADNDLAKSAANPYTIYYYSGNPYDWHWGDGDKDVRTGDLDDLWGNPNATNYDNVGTPGTKSIYDPCPHGYMVVSPRILQEVEASVLNSDKTVDVSKIVEYKESDTKIHKAFVHNGVIWGFSAVFGCSGSIDKSGNIGAALAYWSNSHMKNSNNGRVFWYKSGDTKLTYSRAKGSAAPIRCMVDKENR